MSALPMWGGGDAAHSRKKGIHITCALLNRWQTGLTQSMPSMQQIIVSGQFCGGTTA